MPRKKPRPNTTTPQGKKDSITGLYADINGTRIYTDTTYDQINSPQGRALIGPILGEGRVFSETGSALFEVELGKSAIILTWHTVGQLGSETYGLSDDQPNSRHRFAFIGKFKYSRKGALKGGVLQEIADWSYGQVGDDPNRVGEWQSTFQGTPLKFKGPSGIFPSDTFLEYKVHDYLADYGDNLIEGDPKQNFYNFESSKYFENGWWNNPFTPNLI